MSTQEILRAWRDHDYWLSLSEHERALVPENPAGLVELMDSELENVIGMTHQFTHCDPNCTQTPSCWGTCDGTVQASGTICCC